MAPHALIATALVSATPPPPAPDPTVSRALFLLMLLAAGAFAVVFALAMWTALRSVRRSRGQLSPQEDPRRTEQPDAWGEAGRRVDASEGDHWLPNKNAGGPDGPDEGSIDGDDDDAPWRSPGDDLL